MTLKCSRSGRFITTSWLMIYFPVLYVLRGIIAKKKTFSWHSIYNLINMIRIPISAQPTRPTLRKSDPNQTPGLRSRSVPGLLRQTKSWSRVNLKLTQSTHRADTESRRRLQKQTLKADAVSGLTNKPVNQVIASTNQGSAD